MAPHRLATLALIALWPAVSASQSTLPGPAPRVNAPERAPTFKYLGNYPHDGGAPWSKGLSGVAHDDRSWYFAQRTRLWKIPLEHDLRSSATKADPTKGIFTADLPQDLARQGYFGDPDSAGGYLFVPFMPSTTAGSPRLLVFRTKDLSLVGQHVFSDWNAGRWVALRQEAGAWYLYTSGIVIDAKSPLSRYSIDLKVLEKSVSGAMRAVSAAKLYLPGNDSTPQVLKAASLHYVVGGAFSEDGKQLALQARGIHVFSGSPLTRVAESTSKQKDGYPFLYEFHAAPAFSIGFAPGPSLDFGGQEAPSGLTFWDIDKVTRVSSAQGRTYRTLPGSPKLAGQLHALLVASDGNVYFKHYKMDTSAGSRSEHTPH